MAPAYRTSVKSVSLGPAYRTSFAFGNGPTAVTYRTTTANGTATANTAVSQNITVIAGDLLVVFVFESGDTTGGSNTQVTDDHSGTYAFVGNQNTSTNSGFLAMYVRNAIVPTSTTYSVTVTPALSTNTGLEAVVVAVTGMSKAGAAAQLQQGSNAGAATTTPATTFGANAKTTNTTITAIGCTTNPPGNTAPTGWTSRANVGQTTPLGLQVSTRDNGFTAQTITWGATEASSWAALSIELDSGPAATTAVGTIVPAVGDLFVIYATELGDTTGGTNSTVTDNNGGTYTLVANSNLPSSAGFQSVYVRTALLPNTTSTNVTYNVANTTYTGCEIVIVAVSGMTKVGAAAILQSIAATGAASTTPATTFGANAKTGNLTLTGVASSTNPPGLTDPTSWIRRQNVGQTTPLGLQVSTRDNGFTGATITWGSTSATAYSVFAVELDGSITGGAAITATITPAIGDLLVVVAMDAGDTSTTMTVADNNFAGTYSKIKTATFATGVQSMWVRTLLIENTTPTVVTYTPGSSSETAAALVVVAVSGMNASDLGAILQSANAQSGTSGQTPQVTFAATTLTGNLLISSIASLQGAGPTAPTGFTSQQDQQSALLDLTVATVNSGQTITNVTWSPAMTTNWSGIAIELSSVAKSPIKLPATVFVVTPRLKNTTFRFDQVGGYMPIRRYPMQVINVTQNIAVTVPVFMRDIQNDLGWSGPASSIVVNSKPSGAAFGVITPTSITSRGNGWFDIVLSAAQVATLGLMSLRITAAASAGFNAAQDNNENTLNVLVSIASSVWDEAAANRVAAGTFGELVNQTVATCGSGTNGATTYSTNLTPALNAFKNSWVFWLSGTLKGQSQQVASNDTSGNITMVTAFTAAPSNGDRLIIIGH